MDRNSHLEPDFVQWNTGNHVTRAKIDETLPNQKARVHADLALARMVETVLAGAVSRQDPVLPPQKRRKGNDGLAIPRDDGPGSKFQERY